MTLDKRASAELERPIESRDDLIAYFRAGEKPRDRFRLGIEHEKLALRLGSFDPVPYDGERGIEALLRQLAEAPGVETITEDGRVLGLDGPASVSLEPGGQVEQNGRPHRELRAAVDEIHAHLALIRPVAEPLGIALLGLGAHPFHPTKELTQIPRERYRIMRSYLPSRGELALDMMHATASLQVSFDWSDEADMIATMRASLAVTPIVTALLRELESAPRTAERLHLATRLHLAPHRSGSQRAAALRLRTRLRLRALRGVGARRPDVLHRARRPLQRDERQDLPPLLARRSRRANTRRSPTGIAT